MNDNIAFTSEWIVALDVASEKSDADSDRDDAKSTETADGSNTSHKKKKKKEKVKIAQFFDFKEDGSNISHKRKKEKVKIAQCFDFNKFSKRKYLVDCWCYSTSSGQDMQKTEQCVGGCGQWRC